MRVRFPPLAPIFHGVKQIMYKLLTPWGDFIECDNFSDLNTAIQNSMHEKGCNLEELEVLEETEDGVWTEREIYLKLE